jgi:hypothetical protein
MPTDVKLDQGDGTMLELDANVVRATASDFVLDSAARHTGGQIHRTAGNRRALVHDSADGLTVNFSGDYPGGVTINGSIISLNTLTLDSPSAGDVQVTFFHPPELDQNGNPRVDGFNETILLGVLLSEIRDGISSLNDRVTKLEK